MPSIINATTINGVAISPDNSGSLQLATNNGTTAVTIDTSQNVGIGTSSPNQTGFASPVLSITNGTSGIVELIGTQASDGTLGQVAWYNTSATARIAQILGLRSGANNSGAITFQTASAGSLAERMRITSGGNLLVGTTSTYDNSKTSFARADTTTTGLVLNLYNSASTSTTKANAANRILRIASNASGADTHINFTDSVTNNYLFGGNNGGAYVVANTNGVRLANGGTSWASDSDERIKDIIEPITDAANKVAQLRSVIGKYKTDEEGTRRPFLIAQDVQAVLPEAVFDEQGTLMLAYTDTIPLLVAAIKEQQAMIEELKQEVQLLKNHPVEGTE